MSVIEVWLVAVGDEVDPVEVRRYWNAKETPALDEIAVTSPSLRIGTTEAVARENEADLRGPVGRVIDLLFLRGTIPDYVLPMLDLGLADELLAAFEARPHDPPLKPFHMISSRYSCQGTPGQA
jgi:hypothetical protein